MSRKTRFSFTLFVLCGLFVFCEYQLIASVIQEKYIEEIATAQTLLGGGYVSVDHYKNFASVACSSGIDGAVPRMFFYRRVASAGFINKKEVENLCTTTAMSVVKK